MQFRRNPWQDGDMLPLSHVDSENGDFEDEELDDEDDDELDEVYP